MAGTISGRVVNADGQPVAGVTVTIEESSQPHRDIGAVTGPDGSFRLHGLRPGSYMLAADGATARVELTWANATVEIRRG